MRLSCSEANHYGILMVDPSGRRDVNRGIGDRRLAIADWIEQFGESAIELSHLAIG
jgi:hypothetical protein